MKTSLERILTTHCGSLARPKALLDLMQAKYGGGAFDPAAFAVAVREAVKDVVARQVESGLDVVTDGEQGKVFFATYVRERLSGFEPAPPSDRGAPGGGRGQTREVQSFPEYYAWYSNFGSTRGNISGFNQALVCTGPVNYTGHEAVRADIQNLKDALAGQRYADVFMPATTPRSMGRNEHYRNEEEYLAAIADALREEYQEIVGAGFVVQVDDPGFVTQFGHAAGLSDEERRKRAERDVELVNYAIRGLPPEQVRFHTCYSINVGPRIYDAPLEDVVELMLRINAGAYSFEAANPRHFHDWHVFENVTLPEGKVLIPGMISHTTNIVEHPRFIADQLVNYAKLVGRENVIASNDCGFSSGAMYQPEIHPTVAWEKFRALAEGARLASERLWAGLHPA